MPLKSDKNLKLYIKKLRFYAMGQKNNSYTTKLNKLDSLSIKFFNTFTIFN